MMRSADPWEKDVKSVFPQHSAPVSRKRREMAVLQADTVDSGWMAAAL